MIVEVRVPEVGESISEAVISSWEQKDGAMVAVDDPLFEIETDKVTMTIAAEEAGRLKIEVGEDETVKIGQVVAKIDTDAAGDGKPEKTVTESEKSDGKKAAASAEPEEKAEASARKSDKGESAASQAEESAGEKGREAHDGGESASGEGDAKPAGPAADSRQEREESSSDKMHLPPSVRRMVREHHIDPREISASGGGLSRGDVMRLVRSDKPFAEKASESKAEPSGESRGTDEAPGRKSGGDEPRQTRQKMSPIRRRIAQRLVQSQKEAAILTTFNEADMSNVLAWRSKHREGFEKRHGVGLGFMSFFVKAVVDALRTVPEVNRQVEGEEIVVNHYYDIGVAVSSDRGLVVPVVRGADRLSFAELERTIADLARRVRDKKITLDELTGGVFTVSNGGIFGSLLSTPILNPPQSGVLGMHAIQKRPVAVEDRIEVRPMMYLALSYDHRLVDGREAVTFLRRVKECIEDPERMLLSV